MTRSICALAMLLSVTALADKKAAAPAPAKDEMAKMMAEYERLATPGPEHKMLTDMAGTWTAASKMYMDPSKPPTESSGTEEVKPILGGRFVQGIFKGQMMGKPFEGISTSGYDNAKKKWVMTWSDSMSTAIIYVEGTGDAKQRVYTGEETHPDGKKVPFRWVVKIDGKDKHTMEMYAPGKDGKEAKQMEIVYTRKP